MKITLGFSPCPNDTFIFDALVNNKIETGDLQFEVVLEDVETLNKLAATGKLDITKLSFPALFNNSAQYLILRSGAALGLGVGPLLIAKTLAQVPDMGHCSIAIPGENTTAAFLLGFAFPNARNVRSYLFSEIENAVLNGETDLGVIIHENRFTYAQKGLLKVLDLGAFWEEKTGLPLPLGCIAARRSMNDHTRLQVGNLIRESINYAFQSYPLLSSYVKLHAQEMDEEVMRKHIDLYVNDYSTSLGFAGEEAIKKLHEAFLTQKGRSRELTARDLFIN
ncbi:MAG: 1,4-dihydroxy-6-naphthoate synthase [Chitinophagaceae bacterium]